ncbi:hypothetical protein BN973_03912 [Mycobacterium triplex]|uniref:Uncharacterized protein n=1 Tax=Mycobacterium triplex TaxID=47839 RepID=A0A024K0E9_9MYCO|nr:hypothetical protein BN973_03912 [Mycobacterium triplex]
MAEQTYQAVISHGLSVSQGAEKVGACRQTLRSYPQPVAPMNGKWILSFRCTCVHAEAGTVKGSV